MKTLRYQNTKIAYRQSGKGTVLVFLHGFCEDSSVWDDFKSDLIEEKKQVICIDLPGFGGSERLPEPSIDGMAKAVHTVIENLAIEKFILIGHSMGGYVSLAYAERYPEKLLGLGLFHSHPYPDGAEKKLNRSRAIDFIERQSSILYVKQMIPNLFAPKFKKSNAFLVDKLIYRASQYQKEAVSDALQAMRDRPDRSEVLNRITCPVLFIIGSEDAAIPRQASLEQTHLPRTASIHILEKVGHMGMFEAQRQTQKIIRDFVAFCRLQADMG